MIYTSSYKNFNTTLYKGISISGDRGKRANFKKDSYSLLAPKKSFWKVWHNNIGKLSEEENTKYYIEEYYKHVLSKLNPDKLFEDLNNSFLLCYEDNDEFCHRHIVAAFLELFLNIEIKEVKVNGLNVEEVTRPCYIKQYLEDIIKENINMKGFNSLRALYLFNLSNELDSEADFKEQKFKKSYDYLRQGAAYLRSEADMVEDLYNENNAKKLIKK